MNTGIELGIVDTRNIIKAIHEKHGYDFSDYALTSFKRRLERLIETQGLKNAEFLIEKIEKDNQFIETFLHEINVGATEMFRDPALWRVLKEEVLVKLSRQYEKPTVWIPNCVSGDELFSLLIILKELNMLEKFDITASVICQKTMDKIHSGIFDERKIQLSEDNFKRIETEAELSDYYSYEKIGCVRDISLIKNVNFIKQNIIFDELPSNCNLVLYRNSMIFYNQTLHDKMVKRIYEAVSSSGFLVIGIKEIIPGYFKGFSLINESERIYKKRNI